MRSLPSAVAVSAPLAFLAACQSPVEPRAPQGGGPALRSVAMLDANGRDAGQWPMASRDGSATRFSGLSDILDARDPTSALGLVGSMSDLPTYTARGGTLHVFGLP